MSIRNDNINRLLPAAIFTAATLLVVAGATSLISALATSGPRVGDIITFDLSADAATAVPDAADQDVRLVVDRLNRPACILDLDTITHRGGSMVLEARIPGVTRAFFLHWAGERTSSDADNCGNTADLVVDRRDIDILALTAGGYGVGEKMRPDIGSAVAF
jgi:hypothetical protein